MPTMKQKHVFLTVNSALLCNISSMTS